jgi:hypothetical protein
MVGLHMGTPLMHIKINRWHDSSFPASALNLEGE